KRRKSRQENGTSSPLPFLLSRQARRRSAAGAGQSLSTRRGTDPRKETSTVIKHHREAERGKALARSYDYVIVGAGSAGCVGPRRLGDGTDATVLLLEAGGPDEDVASLANPPQWVENLGSRCDWAYHYEPSPHVAGRAIPLALGKVLGGSGS